MLCSCNSNKKVDYVKNKVESILQETTNKDIYSYKVECVEIVNGKEPHYIVYVYLYNSIKDKYSTYILEYDIEKDDEKWEINL